MNTFEIKTTDKLKLTGYEWKSHINPDSPSALLILLHGLAEYCGRYEDFANFYNENDIAVISMDLRGHGFSEGKHVFFLTEELILEDIDRLIAEARRRYPNCPAVLYGHSMGGNLALSYTLNRYSKSSQICPYRCVVVTGPWIRLAGRLQPTPRVFSVIRRVCHLRPSLKIPLRFNSRVLCRDAEIAAAYKADPNIRRSATLSLAGTMGSLAAKLDQAVGEFEVPVLIQHGGADSLTSPHASESFAQRGKNVEYKNWPNFYHELHHEPDRGEFYDFTIGWIIDKLQSESECE